jgi:outer membrane protein assembly factor BamB
MRRLLIRLAGVSLGAGILLAATSASAVITRITPLRDLLDEAQLIFTAKVESIDADRPAMVLNVDEHLKGKAEFRRLPVLLKGDEEAAKKEETPKLLRRVAPRLPLVVFVHQKDKQYTAFAYTNGTWFQLTGAESEGKVAWNFTHCEPILRKTFSGPTADLKQLVADVLAGKKKPPPPDAKEKPGLGPEVSEEKKEEREARSAEREERLALRAPRSALYTFAVIPSVVVGSTLAFLAMLFPAVFGGLILVLRRWTAALAVLSLNSTLYLAQSWFAPRLAGSWWGTPAALWLTTGAITLLGLLWAWRRHVDRLTTPAVGVARFERPSLGEVVTLGLLSAAGLAAAALWLPRAPDRFDLWDKTLLVWGAGLWAAALHACYLRWVAARRRDPRPGLPGEGVLMGAMMLATTGFAVTLAAPEAAVGDPEASVRVVWRFRLPEKCWVASSPAVEGDRVYVGAVRSSAFASSGMVYCLDRATGKPLWTFNDGGGMKDVFSSPAIAGGKVYIGEGFHQHLGCKLYCLDARSGEKLWEFPTGSHTESSPCVVGGKVYFGAGDDGLFCLDAATGKEHWHLTGLHVDANPLVVEGRVYGGSGRGDVYKDTALFCLDAATGKEQWRVPTDLPVWGMPAEDGGRVFAGIGNGNFMDSEEQPAGRVLCLDARTGNQDWSFSARDGVHTRVVVDAERMYFGSRDGGCYGVDRKTGELRWRQDLGSPVVASPALVKGASGAKLYVAASEGRVCRLDAATGRLEWAFEVAEDAGRGAIVLSSPAVEEGSGGRRRIYFGCGLDTFAGGVLYCLEDRPEQASTVTHR